MSKSRNNLPLHRTCPASLASVVSTAVTAIFSAATAFFRAVNAYFRTATVRERKNTRRFTTATMIAYIAALHCLSLSPFLSRALAQEPPAPPAKDGPKEDYFNVPIDNRTREEVDGYIARLGTPDFSEREQATVELIALGVRTFPQLRSMYQQTDDPEVLMRIRRVARTAFMEDKVYDRNGFLGIQQDTRFYPTHEVEPRVPEGHIGVRIAKVIEDTAAWTAGVESEDIIVAINGEPVPNRGAQSAELFGESIRVRGPGAKITLTILRGQDDVSIEVTLGRRPKNMYNQTGAVQEMLAEARTQFDEWWSKNFAPFTTDAKRSEANPTHQISRPTGLVK